jgi:uncharacterized protein (UPF0261 family)
MSKTIALLGAFDTKGAEYQFVRDCIEGQGFSTYMIDVGVLGRPTAVATDVDAGEVALAGHANLAELAKEKDRGKAIAAMSRGAVAIVSALHGQGKIDAIMALGGTGGTCVATAAMRALPLGIPKVMVSTCASGDVSAYVGGHDIVMIPSIVDVAGINRISGRVLSQAAGAVCGMLRAKVPAATASAKPLIAASMFGNTTPAVMLAKSLLEAEGFEVLVFHCTGTGGRTMERLIEAGLIDGVLDLTTTEWADELVGGVFSAGPTRLDAAAKTATPAIIVPGCLDMVNFWAPETIPAKFTGRIFYRHNPNVTLMRTTVDECRRLGEILAEKANAYKGPVTVLLPLKGVSMIDLEGQPFFLPEANQALFSAVKQRLRKDIPLVELDCAINDPEFARRCVAELLTNLRSGCRSTEHNVEAATR